jgi:hypothetical protein
METASLVQDQDAESQEGGELLKTHDTSLQKKNNVICTTSKFCEPTDLASFLLLPASNSLAS